MNGAAYEAEIILAAQTRGNENDEYQLSDGQGRIEKRDGKWIYTSTVSQSGAHNFNGVVTVKSPKGDKEYPFEGGFQVFSGGATVSATKMNVLYVGIDNDISVGVPGVNPSDVQVSMTGGTIRKQGGNYVARCPHRGDAVITVSARLSDGTTRTVARETYRVKKIRNPYVLLSGLKNGDRVPKQRLLASTSVTATVGPDFPIEGLRYQVTRFQLIALPNRQNAITLNGNGHRLTNGMQRALRELDSGDRLMITGVRANGPNGNLRLEPIMIEII
jgi:gliding motility-associated protein GldM